MNKTNLKAYAPQARRDFIAAVTARANLLGISSESVAPTRVRGDLVIIEGREWPAKINAQREKLIGRIGRRGFEQAMEEVAYTWFNRFAALRFMELHGYLDHGWRALSSTDGGLPELLRHASEVSLPGLNAQTVSDMHLAGTQDNELYKLLLVAQCNELSRSMPFLFERIDDETELLLPENLLLTDSIVAKLVESVPEEDWNQIEVVGWLYQFYISEKKALVIGKVLKSEDIPAATQLFTPNWIVQYLVQNSLGKLWLAANRTSPLSKDWPYHIPFADQSPEETQWLDELARARIQEDGHAIDPESITVLDPACGSGHILVVAYDALKAIYLERGYQPRSIPRLILEKNLYGLDIDDRAAQLAGFALVMKARADDRRLLDNAPKVNVIAFQESGGLHASELAERLAAHRIDRKSVETLIDLFANAKTIGALTRLPADFEVGLGELCSKLNLAATDGDLYAQQAATDLLPLCRQAVFLAQRFDAVVANPPYMGSKYYCKVLSQYISQHYASASADIYACFMLACLDRCKSTGFVTNINIPGWMMNSTFQGFRKELFGRAAVVSLVHNGRGVFGSDFGSCAFTLINRPEPYFKGCYRRLFDNPSTVQTNEALAARFFNATDYVVSPTEFELVAGQPLSYQVSSHIRDAYRDFPPISDVAVACQGLSTSDDPQFVRYWHEVAVHRIGFDGEGASARWAPHNKGGGFRKWFGNTEHVINWEGNGRDIKARKPKSVIRNERFYFKPSISWQDYTIGATSFRYYPEGFVFATNAHSAFVEDEADVMKILGFSNSRVLSALSEAVSPGLHFNSGYFALIPFKPASITDEAGAIALRAVEIAKADWDSFERSWDFARSPLVARAGADGLVASSYAAWLVQGQSWVEELKRLEERNNALFLEAYHLEHEANADVAVDEITLTVNPSSRYGAKIPGDEQQRKFREDAAKELVSYAVGCMMGRYGLDEPGLLYAGSDNQGFDPSRYVSFSADDDGIVPITDRRWFDDDAAERVEQFLESVWGETHLKQNLLWLAEGLTSKPISDAGQVVRDYLAGPFYKDHLQAYKRRPVYWLFSSGKHGAFQALVYAHRFTARSLARMRSEYVLPLLTKMANRLELLSFDATSTAQPGGSAQIQREIDGLRKKQAELIGFDERLRHSAEERIAVDLNEGVKLNYGKFGDLVAEAKAVTGGSDE